MKLHKDPITMTLLARDAYDAETVNFIFQENVEKLPETFSCPQWTKTIRQFPVELYFLFPNKRKYNRFVKELSETRTAIKIIKKYDGGK